VPQPVSRRSFLLASAGLAAAAACGKGSGKASDITVNKSDTNSSNPPKDVSLVVASYIHVAGMDQRVTVALINPDQGPYQAKGPVQVSIDNQPVDAVLHSEGISLPYFLLHHTFAAAGIHEIEASFDGKKLTTPIEVVDPAKSQVPIEGKPLIRTPTPTPANSQGVNPICTRQPPCPFHDVSLDAAMDQKKPIALIFATPALCQSRLCGPVLENLVSMKDQFAGRVTMIHSEIYTDLQGKTLTPAVQAYHLESEPFLFLADATGTVRARLDNAYDKVEVKDALTKLVG
jgi:hypothetical protein